MRSHPVHAVLLGASLMGALTGCSVLTRVTAPDTSAAGDCPPVQAGSGHAAVDYVDFVRAHGTDYVADLRGQARVTVKDVGQTQFRVRCSLSMLNDLTHRSPAPARNHDAAFLAPGTAVHAVQGWSPKCRLVARHDGSWHLYLARPIATGAVTTTKCALPPRLGIRGQHP